SSSVKRTYRFSSWKRVSISAAGYSMWASGDREQTPQSASEDVIVDGFRQHRGRWAGGFRGIVHELGVAGDENGSHGRLAATREPRDGQAVGVRHEQVG